MHTNIYQTKKSVVYIFINLCSPTLKSYVGFTTNLEKRKQEHKSASLNPKFYFHRSIKKDGWENFHCFILMETDDVEYSRGVLEPYYIKRCSGCQPSFSTHHGHFPLHFSVSITSTQS